MISAIRVGAKQLLADDEQMHQSPVVPPGDGVAFVRERRLMDAASAESAYT